MLRGRSPLSGNLSGNKSENVTGSASLSVAMRSIVIPTRRVETLKRVQSGAFAVAEVQRGRPGAQPPRMLVLIFLEPVLSRSPLQTLHVDLKGSLKVRFQASAHNRQGQLIRMPTHSLRDKKH